MRPGEVAAEEDVVAGSKAEAARAEQAALVTAASMEVLMEAPTGASAAEGEAEKTEVARTATASEAPVEMVSAVSAVVASMVASAVVASKAVVRHSTQHTPYIEQIKYI